MTDLIPADWLSPVEADLLAFLRSRLAEDRDYAEQVVEAATDKAAPVRLADLVASVTAVAAGYAWTSEPDRRAVLWLPLLVLSQPYMEHPDYAPEWRADLMTRLGMEP